MPTGGVLTNLESRINRLEQFEAPDYNNLIQFLYLRGTQGELVPNWHPTENPWSEPWAVEADGFLNISLYATNGHGENSNSEYIFESRGTLKCTINGTYVSFAEPMNIEWNNPYNQTNNIITRVKRGDIVRWGNGATTGCVAQYATVSPNNQHNWISLMLWGIRR